MTEKSPYRDLWSNWEDLQSDFDMKQEEPEEVLLAVYEEPCDYSWDAFVAYRNGDKYYTVSGGHCSCYGLGGQWDPEEYTKDQLIAALKKGSGNNWDAEVLSKLGSRQ